MNNSVILTGLMGSHSVGTNLPSSDYDFMSVVLADPSAYLGLGTYGQQGTVESKWVNESGSKCEMVSYEWKKFLRLCLNFNPNVVPLLWLPYNQYVILCPIGAELVNSRRLFNSKKAYTAFSGYAWNQLKDMDNPNKTGDLGAIRKEEIAKYGYCLKKAYHSVRLCRMLMEFLASNGEQMNVYRADMDGDELMSIRNGDKSIGWVRSECETLLSDCDMLIGKCDLPDNPDSEAVERLCVDVVRSHCGLG